MSSDVWQEFEEYNYDPYSVLHAYRPTILSLFTIARNGI